MWIAVAIMANGCGGAAPVLPKLPSQGGPQWIELQTDHFTMWTDLPSAKAHALMKKLEERRQVLARGMNRAPQNERILAIVFRTNEELWHFVDPSAYAISWDEFNPSAQPGIAVSAETYPIAINHELSHAISFALVEVQPRWLGEALACYFEMGEPDPDTGEVVIGVPYPERLPALREGIPLSIRQLFACREGACAGRKFYAWSWALFSFLLDQHFEPLTIYLQRLQDTKGDHDKAWKEAFPKMSLDELDRDLLEWTYNGDLKVVRFKIEPVAGTAVERPLHDADVLAARSLLYFTKEGIERSARAAREAVAADDMHPFAWLMVRANGLEVPDAKIHELIKARPEDRIGWLLLYHQLKDRMATQEELDRVKAHMCKVAAKQKFYCRGDEPSRRAPVRPPTKSP